MSHRVCVIQKNALSTIPYKYVYTNNTIAHTLIYLCPCLYERERSEEDGEERERERERERNNASSVYKLYTRIHSTYTHIKLNTCTI